MFCESAVVLAHPWQHWFRQFLSLVTSLGCISAEIMVGKLLVVIWSQTLQQEVRFLPAVFRRTSVSIKRFVLDLRKYFLMFYFPPSLHCREKTDLNGAASAGWGLESGVQKGLCLGSYSRLSIGSAIGWWIILVLNISFLNWMTLVLMLRNLLLLWCKSDLNLVIHMTK